VQIPDVALHLNRSVWYSNTPLAVFEDGLPRHRSAPHLARALKLFIKEEQRSQAVLSSATHGPASEPPPSKPAGMRLAEATRHETRARQEHRLQA
jgi:hypothetical protein